MAEEGPNIRSQFDLGGTAASPTIIEYLANTGEVPSRSLSDLLSWSASKGVRVPGYIRIFLVDEPLEFQGKKVPAKYFDLRGLDGDERIYLDGPQGAYKLVNQFHEIPLRMSRQITDTDEEFLHVLAHEIFEITELRQCFEPDGYMTVRRFHELTSVLTDVKNIHWRAWEHADRVIRELRGSRI